MPLSIGIVTLNAKFIHTSLSIRYLRNAARAANFENVWIQEFTIHQPIWKIAAEIDRCKPDILGISIYIWNRKQSFELIDYLKKQKPELIVVIGGPEVSFEPQLSKDYFIISGEGESKWVECLNYLKKGEKPSKEVQFRWNSYGEDLPELYPAYIDEDFSKLKHRYGYIESSRGCPYLCSFCISALDKSVRYFNEETIYRQIKSLLNAGIKKIKFVDRTFNLNPHRMKNLMQWLSKRLEAEYHFEVVGDLLTDDMFQFLKTMPRGLFQFEIGIQSTDNETQSIIQRKQNKEKLLQSIKKLIEQDNIHIHCDLIFGLPGESLQQNLNSFSEIFELGPHELQLGFLKFLPGTPIKEKIDSHQYQFMTGPPYEIVSNKDLSAQEVLYLKKFEEAFDLFYNSKRFTFSIDHLSNKYTAIEIFDRLSKSMEKNNAFLNPTSLDSQYKLFEETFSSSREPLTLDILKLDYLYHQRTYRLPDFLQTSWPNGGKSQPSTWSGDRKTPIFPFHHEIKLNGRFTQFKPVGDPILYAIAHPPKSSGYFDEPKIVRIEA